MLFSSGSSFLSFVVEYVVVYVVFGVVYVVVVVERMADDDAGTRDYRIVVLGGGGVGKSAMTIQLIANRFMDDYDPTLQDAYQTQVELDDEVCVLDVFDTAGQEELSAKRYHPSMLAGEGYLCVYDTTYRGSFEEIMTFFGEIEEMKRRPTREVPCVLVGNKIDLEGERAVRTKEGAALARAWNMPFFEVSAKTDVNVKEAFFEMAREIRKDRLLPRSHRQRGGREKRKKKKKCGIM